MPGNSILGKCCCGCVLTLLCDSISSSTAACGFSAEAWDGSADYYSHYTVTKYSASPACTQTIDIVVDVSDCSTTTTCSGECAECDPCLDCGDVFLFCLGGVGACADGTGLTAQCGEPPDNYCIESISGLITSTTCDQAVDTLPPYPETWDGMCSASRDESPDGASCTIQRFKYKFTFPETSAYKKICWKERFTPDGGGGPTDTDKFWEHMDGDPVSESDVFEVVEPGTNGETTIVEYDCC